MVSQNEDAKLENHLCIHSLNSYLSSPELSPESCPGFITSLRYYLLKS